MTAMTTLVRGGDVAIADGSLRPADVLLGDGRIRELCDPGGCDAAVDETIDATGMIVSPGFVDLQINGGWGHDFTADPTTIEQVAARLPETGVTSFLPTIVSSSSETRAAAIDAMALGHTTEASARPVGLHFEGPLLAAKRRGAHLAEFIAPVDADEIDRWIASGLVTMVTIAPEAPDAVVTTRRLTAAGVTVAIGHTDATAEDFDDLRAAGATAVTHLFNAMSGFQGRSPGIVGAALADPTVAVGVICDGIHVHPTSIRVAWRCLKPSQFVLVTDTTAAAGHDAGTMYLGDQLVTVGSDGLRTADGALAGSNLTLDVAVRNLVATTGCSPAEALLAATKNPADAVGLGDRGRIEPGTYADLVLLDDQLNVRTTLIEGVVAWKS